MIREEYSENAAYKLMQYQRKNGRFTTKKMGVSRSFEIQTLTNNRHGTKLII